MSEKAQAKAVIIKSPTPEQIARERGPEWQSGYAHGSSAAESRLQPEIDHLIAGLVHLYAVDGLRTQVAFVCDEVIDTSGWLLGHVRREAKKAA